MSYNRPAERAGALRLHLNENTGGCSPAVVDAIRQISSEDIACYPDYDALSKDCAAYLGVREAQIVLTNGLDEGLMALTLSGVATMHGSGGTPEAIIPLPAFEMYSVFTTAAGGRVPRNGKPTATRWPASAATSNADTGDVSRARN